MAGAEGAPPSARLDSQADVASFHDYTIATEWERCAIAPRRHLIAHARVIGRSTARRLVATIEHCLHTWTSKGESPFRLQAGVCCPAHVHPETHPPHALCTLCPICPRPTDVQLELERQLRDRPAAPPRWRRLALSARLQHRLPLRGDAYTLSLLAAPPWAPLLAPGAEPRCRLASSLGDAPHQWQEWFGVGAVLVLAPDSYSGRVLEEQVRFCAVLSMPRLAALMPCAWEPAPVPAQCVWVLRAGAAAGSVGERIGAAAGQAGKHGCRAGGRTELI